MAENQNIQNNTPEVDLNEQKRIRREKRLYKKEDYKNEKTGVYYFSTRA